jgi:DNA-binding transcriptional LysR family regulator
MRALNLDQLKALAAVAETGSFTAAANSLNLTQSAISVQIRELEERLGVRLIDRLGKKAFATEAGLEVIERARRIDQEVEGIASDMRRRREGWLGRVRLGAAPNILTYLLPPVLKSLRDTYPTLEISIRTGITRNLVGFVLRNELDLALVSLPVEDKGLLLTPWRNDPMVAVFPDSAGDVPRHATPSHMAKWPLILDGRSQNDRMVRAWVRASGTEPKVGIELGQPEAIRNVVAAGLGASIVGPEVAHHGAAIAGGVITRPLRPPLIRTTAFAQRRDKPEDAAMRIMREALMALATC